MCCVEALVSANAIDGRPLRAYDRRAMGERARDEDHESEKQRVDRELTELLNELRVALPGVQMLFGFLLTVPFTQRFASASAAQRHVFFATFVSITIASICLIAPSANHRLRFRAHDKKVLLFAANRFAIAGLFFLGLAIVGVTFVITSILFDESFALTAVAVCAAALLAAWFVVPMAQRLRANREAARQGKSPPKETSE